jgi:hypothetical protein
MEAEQQQPLGGTLVRWIRRKLLQLLDLPPDAHNRIIALEGNVEIDNRSIDRCGEEWLKLKIRVDELEAVGEALAPLPQGRKQPKKFDHNPWTGD